MNVQVNNKVLSNWLEYIDFKFADKNIYSVERQANNDILIRSKTNKTTIWFILKDDNTLIDCQYYNAECKGWSGETLNESSESGVFNQRNVEGLTSVLKTPIEDGWLSVEYFLFNRLLMTKTYESGKKANPFIHSHSFILLPFTGLIGRLIDQGRIGKKVEFVIEPILANAH